ncbi:MAG: N-acetyl-gamma-glutamyl-phosphate reductase [Chloroflexi bacterium]|jgi:N-acetyl-gamma-glutamyl-phosphate reductase|nr:N-acetyl-gamma-glutamyl-phosphate reductase [Chloroflexota bacterium]
MATDRIRIGITGVSGYGGRELLRLCAAHPGFDVVYAGGESSAGRRLCELEPALIGQNLGNLTVAAFDPDHLDGVELLFASLPTGASREPLARVPGNVRVIDVGGDHRFVDGWAYGLTELPGVRPMICGASRVANPGCYPAATLLALAPIIAAGIGDPEGIVVDAKSGVSGAGRGGRSEFGFAETNEDVMPYGLERHSHVPEITEALTRLQHGNVAETVPPGTSRATVAFTPHLIPMTRGIIATCYVRPLRQSSVDELHDVAGRMYANEPFVRVVPPINGRGPRSTWATGSNLCFVGYARNHSTGHIICIGAIDNLGKGAAGQAVQNANLMVGLPEVAGLQALPLAP